MCGIHFFLLVPASLLKTSTKTFRPPGDPSPPATILSLQRRRTNIYAKFHNPITPKSPVLISAAKITIVNHATALAAQIVDVYPAKSMMWSNLLPCTSRFLA
jgi:hypothetical protein